MKYRRLNYFCCLFILIFFFGNVLSIEKKVDFPGNVDLVHYDDEKVDFHSKPVSKSRVSDKVFYVFPGVIVPSIFSALLVEHSEVFYGEDVLDIGTGSGVQGIFAADYARRVISTDLSALSVENARLNVKLHNLEGIVEVRHGDLFKPIKTDEKFDVIFFNIDSPYNERTQGLWLVHERFFEEVERYLKPNGRIYYQSGRMENIPHVHSMVIKNNLRIMKMNMVAAIKQHREPIVMLIQREDK